MGPPEKFHQKILKVLSGTDTIAALTGPQSQGGRNPEALIKLGIKYQERQDRDKALELFQRAASLDPGKKIMMRRENGERVSCAEMADYQYARTFMVTFGVMDHRRLLEFVDKHPSSPLVRDAYLDLTRGVYFTEEDGVDVYGRMASRFPYDVALANRLADHVAYYSRSVKQGESDANLGLSLMLSENALREAENVSLAQTAQNLAKLQIVKGSMDKAEESYGRKFLSEQIKTWTENLIGYAEFWLERKQNTEDAESAVRLAFSLSPADPGLRRRAAFLYHVRLTNMDKALDVFGPEYLKTILDSPKDLYSYFSFWAQWKKNEASAFEALEALLKQKPDSLYYRVSAASVLWRAEYRDRALAVFGPDFIAGRQEDMNALYEYGMFWLQRDSLLDQAVPALVKSLRAVPKTYMTHYQAAKLLVKNNRLGDATAIFGPEYLIHIRNDASALSMYSQFWLTEAKSNKDSAFEALETAAQLKSLNEWDRMSIARQFFDSGKTDRAEAVYGAEFLKTIGSDAEALIRYASFWKYGNRNLNSALDAAQRASRAAPGNAKAWGILAELYMANADLAQSLQAVDQACSLTKSKKDFEKYETLRKQIKAELEKIKKSVVSQR
ncbi:MAG: hypothetical protein NTU60_07310 [Candidatus Aminicenantes bacterium]|nr:hypothetical protein [Candidatus Aminicenantes bacterium]